MITLIPPAQPIDSDIVLPGSKSYTNRALIIASAADGTSRLINASPSRDSIAMKDALEKLGVTIEIDGENWTVTPPAGGFAPYQGIIDVGPAGTTMRFLCALLASIPGIDVRLQGSERMHDRPINDLVDALRQLGADITYLGKPNCPPLLIRGRSLSANGTITVSGEKSSQFLTALLLIAPRIGGFSLTIPGTLVSKTYVEMALDTMRAFGASVACNAEMSSFTVGSDGYHCREYEVEADASGASYFWGLAAVNAGRIRINGVNPHSVQGDMRFPLLLEEMGCTRAQGSNWIEITGSPTLSAIACDMTLMPDTAQTLAVVAAVARGETIITGLSTLKIKETDRLEALKTELAKCGIYSRTDEQSIAVVGGAPRKAEISTYEDHRMAMSFAILGALPQGISIHEPHVVEKSFPDFWTRLTALGFQIQPPL